MRESYGGFGPERQASIYRVGRSGKPPAMPVSPEGLEAAARTKLPAEVFDYVAGGAGSEETARSNLRAFGAYRITPRVLADVSERDTRIEILGSRLPAPLLLAPVGVLGAVHPQGDLAAASAASALGIPFTLSTAASFSIEEVARASGEGPRWFQLYWGRDPEVNWSLVSRAEAAGYRAIVVTLDTKMLGWRERDLGRGYLPFLHGLGIANYLSDPVFRSRLRRPPEEDPEGAVGLWSRIHLDPALDWKQLRSLRERTRLPILLKGVVSGEDVRLAVEHGFEGVIVSNHGGRQLDGGIAALAALPSAVSAAAGRTAVLFDSGIRRGSDILIALALGARAVGLGRPYVYGLALAGEEGVRTVLENLLAELDIDLALSGRSRITEVDRSLLSGA